MPFVIFESSLIGSIVAICQDAFSTSFIFTTQFSSIGLDADLGSAEVKLLLLALNI